MCGSGGDPSKYARQQERERNARIDQGKVDLEKIFAPLEGASYDMVNPTTLGETREEFVARRAKELYDQKRSEPYGKVKTLGKQDDYARKAGAEYDALLRDEGSYERREGDTTPIWEQQSRAFRQYANPELRRQKEGAREDLGFALQRQGVGSSSIAGDRWAKQAGDFARAEQDVNERALEVGSQAKGDIARQKQSLLTMLTSTGDAGAAAESARLGVASLRDPPRTEPLGVLFQNTTAGLAGGLDSYRQGQQLGRYNQTVYGGDPNRGSGRVVR